MKACPLTLTWYSRPLKVPLRIKEQSLCERRGFFLELGGSVFAECAPLPGLHQETLEELAQSWQAIAASLLKAPLAWERWQLGAPFFGLLEMPSLSPAFFEPALQSSVEMLLLGLALRRGKLGIASSNPSTPFFEHSALLQIPAQPTASWWRELEIIKESRIRVLKVKIGRTRPAAEQALMLEIKNFMGSDASWRLDANQSLEDGELRDWLKFLERENWPIDYIEEPSPHLSSMIENRWPVGLDESLRGRGPETEIFRSRVVILKPNSLGLSRSLAWLQLAARCGGRIVLSNAYESSLSLKFYTWLYGRLLPKAEALGLGTEAAFCEGPTSRELQFGVAHVRWPESPWLCPEEAAPLVKREDLGLVFPGEASYL